VTGFTENRTCWLVDPVPSNPLDVQLVVRTANIPREEPGYPDYTGRLQAVAQKMYEDWLLSLGLVGLQELEPSVDDCLEPPPSATGLSCFERSLGRAYGGGTTTTSFAKLGIVAGAPWNILRGDHWKIGSDGLFEDDRYLLEAYVRNDSTGRVFRFYTTHLSHDSHYPDGSLKTSRARQRVEETSALLGRIIERVQPGELPPIVVGDFNASMDQRAVYESMKARFENVGELALHCLGSDAGGAPNEVPFDHLWIGRPNAFTGTQGHWRILRYHTDRRGGGLDLRNAQPVRGAMIPLSDHDSPGASLAVDPE
jgi:hypothetical protein